VPDKLKTMGEVQHCKAVQQRVLWVCLVGISALGIAAVIAGYAVPFYIPLSRIPAAVRPYCNVYGFLGVAMVVGYFVGKLIDRTALGSEYEDSRPVLRSIRFFEKAQLFYERWVRYKDPHYARKAADAIKEAEIWLDQVPEFQDLKEKIRKELPEL